MRAPGAGPQHHGWQFSQLDGSSYTNIYASARKMEDAEARKGKNISEHQVSSNTVAPQQIAQRTGKMQRGQGETFQSTR